MGEDTPPVEGPARSTRFWVRLQRRLYATGADHNLSWFPELGFCDSPAEQADLWRTCYLRLLRRRWPAILLKVGLVSAVLQVAAAGLYTMAWRHFSGWPSSAAWLVGVMLAGGGTGYALMVIIRNEARLEIRRTLIARGVRLCLACGYDLRGAEHARCPECGTAPGPLSGAAPPPNRQ